MDASDEKQWYAQQEYAMAPEGAPGRFVHVEAASPSAQPATERRALTKFNLVLLPQLFILSILANLDRTNIGNAKVMGMQRDLHLKGNQFNTVSTVFFPTYIILEIPWVLAIKKFGISRVFAVSMVGWGIITIGTGFVQSFHELLALRVLLGAFEASVIPSIVFTISMIWEPSAQAKPVSVYYLGACVSGAIGGLIAYGVEKMGPRHGLEAWRWLFIIEGIVSTVLCSLFLLTMPLSPEKAWFLNASEKEAMSQRKERNAAIRGNDKFDWTYFRMAMINPLVWLGALALFSNTIPLLGLTIFLPTLLSGLGYKGVQLQYLTIPVWLVGALFVVITTFASDRFKRRGFCLMLLPLPTIAGYAMLIGSSNKAVGYIAMFLVAPAMLSYNTIMLTWISSNISPDYKRAISFPITTALSNIAGILSSQIYPASQAPRYIQGGWIALAFEILASVCAASIWFVLRRRNAQKDKLTEQGVTDNGEEGDKAIDFRHSL